jgi:2-methylcitrate dehydratase PrpD
VRPLLCDHLGVTIAGASTESAAVMRRHLRTWSTTVGAEQPMLGSAQTGSALDAAMANAVAAHSIEFDDVHCPASLHPGVVVFPAAFAAHGLRPSTEEDFLTAVLRGYEAMCRVGRALNPVAHYARHFHPTGTTGSFASAVVAASMLGLDPGEATAALGVAASLASGSMEFLTDGAWTKRLHPAFAVRNGIQAALLVTDGILAPTDGLAGARGFLQAYSADSNPEELLRAFGERPLEISLTSIKPHSCCRYVQGPIDAVLSLRASHGIDPGRVHSVKLGIPTVARDIVAEPRAEKRSPANVVDAQFSLPFGAAVALLEGRAGLTEYSELTISSTAVQKLMKRVEHVVDPALDAVFPDEWLAWAEITTDDGQVWRSDIAAPKGDPLNPVSDEELEAKFRDLVKSALAPDDSSAVLAAVGGIDGAGGLERLQRALTAATGVGTAGAGQ